MKIAGIVVVSSLLIVLLIRAAGSQPTIAERSEILPGPRTRLEAITGSSGAVLVRQYTEVGLLGHGAISVAAIMVTNVTSETETKGLLISPSEGTGGMRNAYVDYDEIPGLLSGIDYLASVDLATLKLANFAASYQTRGNLNVTVYSDVESKKAFISTGRLSSDTQHLDLQELAHFRELITVVKNILDNPDSPEAKRKLQVPETVMKPEVVQPENAVPPRAVPQARPKSKAKGKTRAQTKPKPKTKGKG